MNKKHRFSIVIAVLLLAALFPAAALAAPSVTVQASPSRTQVGETVAISGTAVPGELLSIKVTDVDGNIVYFGAARADSSGAYQTIFIVPNLSPQALTVVAGSGSNVATAHVEIYVPSTPTPTPTPEPTNTPTPTPTHTSEPTNTPMPTATHTSEPTGTPTPTGSSAPSGSSSPTGTPTPSPTESGDHELLQTGDGEFGWIWWLLGGLFVAAGAVILVVIRKKLRKG